MTRYLLFNNKEIKEKKKYMQSQEVFSAYGNPISGSD
jgi:hypothetical protein